VSSFDDAGVQWRDTYFIWFPSARRPTLRQVQAAVKGLSERFDVKQAEADDDGGFESITLVAARDGSVIDISYLAGDDLREQAQALAEEIKESGDAPVERLAKLSACDARLDLMQFEPIDEAVDEEDDDSFDPSSLLVVLESLAKLVHGIGVDPQSGLLA
jgi:hypothetical protein